MTDHEHQANYVDGAARSAVDALAALVGEAAPGTVFSQPEQVGEDLVITAVAWERAGGFGFGGGGGTGGQGDAGGGAGAGGGGSSQGRPVAVVRVTPSGVEVTPLIDLTKIGVTLLLGVFGLWRAVKK